MSVSSPLPITSVGVVVIGRNEGERLRQCLISVSQPGRRIVYVDSGSTDGSVRLAKALGADVVELNASEGFTAARARNAGFNRMIAQSSEIKFVQFLDGDCVLDPHWIEKALETFAQHNDAAVVCGRRRERHPEASVYNRLCDMEWNTAVGIATECGGDAMMRVDAFRSVDGFDDELIAGEEPELCVRLRTAGWTIHRIAAEMTLHDAAMTRFSQWWNRNLRAGHAFAQGSSMHGRSPARHWIRQTRSNWVWGLAIPILCLLLAFPTKGLSLLALSFLYLMLIAKVALNGFRSGRPRNEAATFAMFCVIGKVPQAMGQVRFMIRRATGKRPALIEYKGGSTGVIPG